MIICIIKTRRQKNNLMGPVFLSHVGEIIVHQTKIQEEPPALQNMSTGSDSKNNP